MSTIIPLKPVTKTTLNIHQKTFNRLKKKVQVLRNRLKETETALEKALQFFKTEISPLKRSILISTSDFIKLLYRCYKNPKKLSKRDKIDLKEIIVQKCYETSKLSNSIKDIDLEVQAIFKELEGVDFTESYSREMEEGKAILSEMCKELNLDVNLSSLETSDDEESIIRKVFQAMHEAHEKQQAETPHPTKPKSKKEIQKEIKAQELEQLQHKGLGTIYKQLAKALHPDLEQDPMVKAEKEQLMKRLTTAYENEDLHTLLSIEMEWLNRTESDEREGRQQTDEQLKIFNSLLKDQVEELEFELEMTSKNPRFYCLQDFNLKDVTSMMFQLAKMRNELKNDIRNFKEIMGHLTSPGGEDFLVNILRV